MPDPIINVRQTPPSPTEPAQKMQMPYFKLFQCRTISVHKMDYVDVVSALLDVLVMIGNKTDTLIMSGEMVKKYL
jgi:hypothetical protein